MLYQSGRWVRWRAHVYVSRWARRTGKLHRYLGLYRGLASLTKRQRGLIMPSRWKIAWLFLIKSPTAQEALCDRLVCSGMVASDAELTAYSVRMAVNAAFVGLGLICLSIGLIGQAHSTSPMFPTMSLSGFALTIYPLPSRRFQSIQLWRGLWRDR